MLLRKKPDLTGRKVVIKLPAETWSEFDRLVEDAERAGHTTALEAALAQALVRMIGRARRELADLRDAGGIAGANEQKRE